LGAVVFGLRVEHPAAGTPAGLVSHPLRALRSPSRDVHRGARRDGVEMDWEQLAHGLDGQAKAVIYDLAKLLRDRPASNPPEPPAQETATAV
jgi:hypothetical protein